MTTELIPCVCGKGDARVTTDDKGNRTMECPFCGISQPVATLTLHHEPDPNATEDEDA